MQTYTPEYDPLLQAMGDCKRAQQEIIRLRTKLNDYVQNRLTQLEYSSQSLLADAERMQGDEYRATLGLIGDYQARKQELLLLERSLT